MKNLRKYVTSILTLFLLMTGFCSVCADDEETAEESGGYSASYVFVCEDGTELPEEVLRFVPETRSGLHDGDTVRNDKQPDVWTNDYVYEFVSWDKEELTIDGSDVTITGSWRKRERLKDGLFVAEETLRAGESAQTQGSRSSSTLYQTLRWDNFEGAGGGYYGTYEDGTRFYPSLYFVALSRNADGTLKDRRICFCVQHDYSFYKGKETTYTAYDLNEYPLLSQTNKTKIVRIASYALKQSGMNWSNGKWNNWQEALAAQIAIWMIIADNNNTPNHRRLTIDTDLPFADQINSRASYYYGTVANQDSSEGIHLQQNEYSGIVGEVFKVGMVDNPSGATVTLSNGVVFCDADGNPASSPQWEGRYFYVKATQPVTNASQRIKVLPSGQQEALFLDHPSTQNVVMSGAAASVASFKVTAIQMNLYVVKTAEESDFDFLKECPNNYSLAGAVYGVYRDSDCTDLVGTLTSGENGRTQAMSFNEEGTYYVRELTPSPGFALDARIYTAVIVRGQDTIVTSVEPPLNDPFRIRLQKRNAKDGTKTKYLDTAEFVLRYYDTQEDDVSEMEAKYEWTFHAAYSKTKEAEVLFDEEHYVGGDVLLLNDYDDFYLPLGTFTIQETKAPQTYLIDENIYIGHIIGENGKATVTFVGGDEWDYLSIENESLIQNEREAIQTVAYFKESGENHYPADGYATIMDKVLYDYLEPGTSYTLVSKLVNKETGEIVLMDSTEFVPEKENGSILVKVGEMELTELANTSYVCYEYLYVTEDIAEFTTDISELNDETLKEYLVTYHEDLEDEKQTLHVDELYSAAFVLYKIGDNDKGNKLSGAYFDVSTKRIRRDGTVVEKELGTYVTGGIHVEDDESFTVRVYSDEAMTKMLGSYESAWNSRFRKQAVTILDLEDGIYYVRKNEEENCSVYHVGKGMIYLPDQEEDTEITFQELVAPIGYAIEMKPFTMTVGHDDKVKTVENYRANFLLYIPVTGRDA